MPEDSVHGPAIEWMAEAGITTGCGDGKYCPDAPVTRAQMATFLKRYHDNVVTSTPTTTTTEAPTTTTTGSSGSDIAGWRYSTKNTAYGVEHEYTSSVLSSEAHDGKYVSIGRRPRGTCYFNVGNTWWGYDGKTLHIGYRFSDTASYRWVEFKYLLGYGTYVWLTDSYQAGDYATWRSKLRDAEPAVMEWFTGSVETTNTNKVPLVGVTAVFDALD